MIKVQKNICEEANSYLKSNQIKTNQLIISPKNNMKPISQKINSKTLSLISQKSQTELALNESQTKAMNKRSCVSSKISKRNEENKSESSTNAQIQSNNLSTFTSQQNSISTNQASLKSAKQINLKDNINKISNSQNNQRSQDKKLITNNYQVKKEFLQAILETTQKSKDINQKEQPALSKSNILTPYNQSPIQTKKLLKKGKSIPIYQQSLSSKEANIKSKEKKDKILDRKQNYLKISLPQSRTLPSKFFEIINDKLSYRITSFLPITDLLSLACLSKKSRKLVPIVMQNNFSIMYDQEEFLQLNSSVEFHDVYQLFRIKEDYFNLVKRSLSDLEKIIFNCQLSKIPCQDIILEILAAGESYSSNFTRSKVNILDHLTEKGIINSFTGLNLNYVTPIKFKITLPPYPNIRDNEIGKFVKVIHQYVEYKQQNKLSIEKQKSIYQQILLHEERQKYIKITQKVLHFYKKPILRMTKGNSILEYANKNTMFIIISFLKLSEIVSLICSGKQMRFMIHQVIQDKLIQMESIREIKLMESGLSSELAQAIIYSNHLKLFKREHHYLQKQKYNSSTFKKIIITILKATSLYEGKAENADLIPSKLNLLHFRQCIPTPEKIHILHDFMQTYPTLRSFKEQLIKEKLNYETTRDCIILYLSILGLINLVKLNQNNQNWEQTEDAYKKQLFSIDAKIYYLKKLIGKSEEDLFIFLKERIVYRVR